MVHRPGGELTWLDVSLFKTTPTIEHSVLTCCSPPYLKICENQTICERTLAWVSKRSPPEQIW
jgi:hypothetical protein